TESSGPISQIGEITYGGVVSEFPVPTSGSSPSGITTGPDGNPWFTEATTNQIGQVEWPDLPSSGTSLLGPITQLSTASVSNYVSGGREDPAISGTRVVWTVSSEYHSPTFFGVGSPLTQDIYLQDLSPAGPAVNLSNSRPTGSAFDDEFDPEIDGNYVV